MMLIRLVILILAAAILFATLTVTGSDNADHLEWWAIGGKKPKLITLVDADVKYKVKVCPKEQGGSSYPVTLIVEHDGKRTLAPGVGECKSFEARKLSVLFATPSSFKFAVGTYNISAL